MMLRQIWVAQWKKMVINGEEIEWQPWAVVVRGVTTLWTEIEVMA